MLAGPLREKVNFVELVADGEVLTGFLPLDRFTRLIEQTNESEGAVSVALRFSRIEARQVLVEGEISTTVVVTCQSCLEAMTLAISETVRTRLLSSFAELDSLLLEQDGIVVEPPLVSLVELLEDELILGLPMVARHETCPAGVQTPPNELQDREGAASHRQAYNRADPEGMIAAEIAAAEQVRTEASLDRGLDRENEKTPELGTYRPFADLQGLMNGKQNRQDK